MSKDRSHLLKQLKLEPHEDLPAYAWPGGYPIYYVTVMGSVLCPECANSEEAKEADPHDNDWRIETAATNWEDPNLYCDNCSERIESAYAEDEIDSPSTEDEKREK